MLSILDRVNGTKLVKSAGKLAGLLYTSVLLLGIIIIFVIIVLNLFQSSIPSNLDTNLLDVFVNGLLTIGLLFLYYQTGKTQESQEESLTDQAEALSKQAETLSRQTEELTKQRGIMEKQQEIEEQLNRIILDIEGCQVVRGNDIKVCVSNHGGGIARNIRLLIHVQFETESWSTTMHDIPLTKISEKDYLTEGNTVGPEEKQVELIASFECTFIDGNGDEQYCNFPEMTMKATDSGINTVQVRVMVRAEDQHGNMDESTLYDFESSIYPNMDLVEAVN